MTDLDKLKPVSEWARIDGVSYNTAIKRRAASGLGVQIPPHTWLLSKEEWEQVKRTPMPGCRALRG